MNTNNAFTFIKWLLSSVFKDMIILYCVIFLAEWAADIWKLSRSLRAWWITLIIVAIVTFVLWYHFGRILIFH
jgi:hypothetical protein